MQSSDLTLRDKNAFIFSCDKFVINLRKVMFLKGLFPDIGRIIPRLSMKASSEPPGLTQELKNKKLEKVAETDSGSDLFENIKHRFLSFKKHKYM